MYAQVGKDWLQHPLRSCPLGADVKSGEKGIKILAPAPYKIKKDVAKTDPDTGQPIIGADGKPVTEQQEVTIPAFKVVSVFDVSQTEGKELPDIAVDALTGNVEQYEDFWLAMGYTVLLCFCLFKTGSMAKAVFSAH